MLPAQGRRQTCKRASSWTSGRTVTFNFCAECGGTVFWAAELRPDPHRRRSGHCLLILNLKDPVFRSGRAGSILGSPPLANRKSTGRTENRLGQKWAYRGARSDAQRIPYARWSAGESAQSACTAAAPSPATTPSFTGLLVRGVMEDGSREREQSCNGTLGAKPHLGHFCMNRCSSSA